MSFIMHCTQNRPLWVCVANPQECVYMWFYLGFHIRKQDTNRCVLIHTHTHNIISDVVCRYWSVVVWVKTNDMASVWWSRPNKVPCLNIWLDSPSLVHLLSTYNVIKKNCWLDTAACHMTLLRGWCFNFGNGCLCWKKRNLEKETSLHEFLRWENTKNEMKCGSRTGAFHLPPHLPPPRKSRPRAIWWAMWKP